MLQNMYNKFFFFVIDLEKNNNFIKNFVEFTSFLNEDDGIYLINDTKDILAPSYSVSVINKYPFQENKLKMLINDSVSVIKEIDTSQVKIFLLIFTKNEVNFDYLDKIKSVYDFNYIVESEFNCKEILEKIGNFDV